MHKEQSFKIFVLSLLATLATLVSPPSPDVSAQETPDAQKALAFHFSPTPNYLPTQSKLNSVEFSSLDEIRQRFANPGVDYATAPLWVWNDLLTEEQVRSTLADLNAQRVNMAFVHPRPGLATPYLTQDWFTLWSAALDEAQKRGMKIWIYDENSYPSGFAGGYVPDAFPESRGFGLDVVSLDNLIDASGNWQIGESVVYVVERLSDGSTLNRTTEVLAAKEGNKPAPNKSSEGSKWTIGRYQYAGSSQWFGGKTYVNLMTKGVLDAFLGFTHETYRERLGDQFGKLIPGAFTDEPQVASAGMFSWTTDFPEEFQKRRGYDIIPNIDSLIEPVGDWKKVRYDYYKTVLETFIERWHKPLAEYCESVGLEYTGHDWEHEWPNAHQCPDNMATAFWRQRPAIDLLMNQFSRGTHSQFGNVRSVRELNSATRQSGRSRSISENYGAGGYDIRFRDLKRLGDWSYALGVNTTDEHLSYISIRGARKHDHPQTFSYHSPWFEQYSKLEDYWTRLSYLLSRGELSQKRFLLIEPTSTTWLYQTESGRENQGKKDRIGNDFANLLNELETAQVDYDLGSEDIIGRVGKVDGASFWVGKASYKTVVLPESVETLDAKTVQFLAEFLRNGGKVVSLNANLTSVNGRSPEELDETTCANLSEIIRGVDINSLEELVVSSKTEQSAIVTPKSNGENVFHQLRETKDAIILFVCNIDLDKPAQGNIVLAEELETNKVEQFDPLSGKISIYPSNEDGALPFDLEPCSSLALVVSKSEHKERSEIKAESKRLNPWNLADKFIEAKPCDDNVLPLDYMTLTLGNETLEDEYFYRANAWFWRKKGYPMSPWDNGVQFRNELITKKFEDDSGFEIVYKFVKSDAPVNDLRFVTENPEMYEVFCNGQKIPRIPGDWKFDRAFGVFDISKAVKTGTNEIKLIAEKSTIFCELTASWIIGSFSLEPAEHGFTVVADKGLTFDANRDASLALPKASSEPERVSWLSSGVGFSNNDDRDPFIAFQFKDPVKISTIQIWNYNETNLTKRGVKSFELRVTNSNGVDKQIANLPKTYEIEIGDSNARILPLPQLLELDAFDRLVFSIKSNWNGITYPLADDFVGTVNPENDNAFVGLAEVRFLDENGINLEPIVSASSELVFRSHERRARFVSDGSGMEAQENGWAAQGRPFYAGAVDYKFALTLDGSDNNRPTVFELSDHSLWNGAVAAILLDDEQIGAIGWDGDSVDLTPYLADAIASEKKELTLTVRLYGTPKNLFGPHHAGKLRGSAWPGSFHAAPVKQPSGKAYDVIEYGLFGK